MKGERWVALFVSTVVIVLSTLVMCLEMHGGEEEVLKAVLLLSTEYLVMERLALIEQTLVFYVFQKQSRNEGI